MIGSNVARALEHIKPTVLDLPSDLSQLPMNHLRECYDQARLEKSQDEKLRQEILFRLTDRETYQDWMLKDGRKKTDYGEKFRALLYEEECRRQAAVSVRENALKRNSKRAKLYNFGNQHLLKGDRETSIFKVVLKERYPKKGHHQVFDGWFPSQDAESERAIASTWTREYIMRQLAKNDYDPDRVFGEGSDLLDGGFNGWKYNRDKHINRVPRDLRLFMVCLINVPDAHGWPLCIYKDSEAYHHSKRQV